MKNATGLRGTGLVLAALLGLGVTSNANAILIDSVGDTFTVDFTGNGGALNASVQFTVTDWAIDTLLLGDFVGFDVDVTNNSPLASTRLTAFSIIDVNPELILASADDGWDAAEDVNAGGGYNTVDLCLYDGNNCNGGGNQGVAGGGFEDFNLDLWFTSLTGNGLDLNGFAAKFQTATGSFHIAGCVRGSTSCQPPVTQVPEPGTLSLLGLSLIGLAAVRRRIGRSEPRR